MQKMNRGACESQDQQPRRNLRATGRTCCPELGVRKPRCVTLQKGIFNSQRISGTAGEKQEAGGNSSTDHRDAEMAGSFKMIIPGPAPISQLGKLAAKRGDARMACAISPEPLVTREQPGRGARAGVPWRLGEASARDGCVGAPAVSSHLRLPGGCSRALGPRPEAPRVTAGIPAPGTHCAPLGLALAARGQELSCIFKGRKMVQCLVLVP